MKKIFHRCFICGKLVLWDSDKIGFHMKFQHRILEREYNAKYCINLDESLEAPDKNRTYEIRIKWSSNKPKSVFKFFFNE